MCAIDETLLDRVEEALDIKLHYSHRKWLQGQVVWAARSTGKTIAICIKGALQPMAVRVAALPYAKLFREVHTKLSAAGIPTCPLALSVKDVKALPVGSAVMVNRTGPSWFPTFKGRRLEHLQMYDDRLITINEDGRWDYVGGQSEHYQIQYEEVPQ